MIAMSHFAPTLPIGTIWATASLTSSSDASTPASLDSPAKPPLSRGHAIDAALDVEPCAGLLVHGSQRENTNKHLLSSLAVALVLMLQETEVNHDCVLAQHMWGCQDQGLM